jgi:hypothetical protein
MNKRNIQLVNVEESNVKRQIITIEYENPFSILIPIDDWKSTKLAFSLTCQLLYRVVRGQPFLTPQQQEIYKRMESFTELGSINTIVAPNGIGKTTLLLIYAAKLAKQGKIVGVVCVGLEYGEFNSRLNFFDNFNATSRVPRCEGRFAPGDSNLIFYNSLSLLPRHADFIFIDLRCFSHASDFYEGTLAIAPHSVVVVFAPPIAPNLCDFFYDNCLHIPKVNAQFIYSGSCVSCVPGNKKCFGYGNPNIHSPLIKAVIGVIDSCRKIIFLLSDNNNSLKIADWFKTKFSAVFYTADIDRFDKSNEKVALLLLSSYANIYSRRIINADALVFFENSTSFPGQLNYSYELAAQLVTDLRIQGFENIYNVRVDLAGSSSNHPAGETWPSIEKAYSRDASRARHNLLQMLFHRPGLEELKIIAITNTASSLAQFIPLVSGLVKPNNHMHLNSTLRDTWMGIYREMIQNPPNQSFEVDTSDLLRRSWILADLSHFEKTMHTIEPIFNLELTESNGVKKYQITPK